MSDGSTSNRREVLLAMGAGLTAVGIGSGAADISVHDIPYRVLGHTGEKVSCIGMGGYHLGKKEVTEADAIKLVHAGVDRGINFLDNSWDYNEGIHRPQRSPHSPVYAGSGRPSQIRVRHTADAEQCDGCALPELP